MPFDAKVFEDKHLEEMASSSAVSTPNVCLVNGDTVKAWKRWSALRSERRVAVKTVKPEAGLDEAKKEISAAELVSH
jgi:hypothetical protein